VSSDGHPFSLQPIGWVRSAIVQVGDAPRQGDEGPSRAEVVVHDSLVDALEGIAVGDRLVVLTWLHLAARDETTVRPRGDVDRPEVGVFATRSPGRPNPIGLHTVTVLGIDGTVLTVDGLEAVDGTPVVDLKPELGPIDQR
jgi:tRNA-Thr(GGU) m(6)t(6)A37 methyltransferase TsaA